MPKELFEQQFQIRKYYEIYCHKAMYTWDIKLTLGVASAPSCVMYLEHFY